MIIYGVNPVRESLVSNRIHISAIYFSTKKLGFESRGVPVFRKSRDFIGKLTGTSSHQGIAAEIGEFPYESETSILALSKPQVNLVMLDRVNDPHNLGAVIRVCDGAGMDAVIIGEKFGTGVTSTVFKTSAGAAAHVPIIRSKSLAGTTEQLLKADFTVFSVENGVDAISLNDANAHLSTHNLFIFGSEGEGISRALLRKSHHIVTLPMRGHVNSLNLSTSVAATLYSLFNEKTVKQ